MDLISLTVEDKSLIEAAAEVVRKNFHKGRHTVGAAVLCSSGRVYCGVNMEACGYGPCAEPIAIGTAISNGERQFLSIVAVHQTEGGFQVLSPCGNCRQLLLDYAPQAMVILGDAGKVGKVRAVDLLPGAYKSCFD